MADDRFDAVPQGSLESFVLRTEGWTSLAEARVLYELAREVVSGCIVEIGSYRGRSTVALGRGSLDGHGVPVFAIEPHAPFTGILGGRFGPADAGAFHQAMVDSGCYHVVRLVSLPSEQAARGWQSPIALLWIDGDHREDAVRRDVESWWPHLLAGARVVFDDAADPALGPSRVVAELLARGRAELVLRQGKLVVLRAA